MYDAVAAAHLRGATPPSSPSLASPFFAFTARLGTFLLAAVLGTGWWVFTLYAGVMGLSIWAVLAALVSGGVWVVVAVRRTPAGLVRYVGGLLVALACGVSILALTWPVLQTEYGWLLMSCWAGAIAIVVTYLVAGLRAAPPPYQRYANLGYGVASWFLVTALTLPVPDQGFTTLSLLGLPFAALGGLVGGALHRAFLGSASPRRLSRVPQEQGESGARDAPGQPGQAAPEAVPRASPRPAASRGLAWRLLVAGLLGICAVPFGPGEPVTLAYSLLVLGFFAGIAIVLDLSLLGWRPGLILLLGGVIAIAWRGGAAIVQATGPLLFALPMGAVAQAAFVAFVGICALLCVLAVDGAHLDAGREPADRRKMVHLARHVVFWLAAGLFCWLGIATILLWRGWPGMLMGSETPGQIALAGALPLVVRGLPAALLGALVGGAVRWALLHATAHLPFSS
jgi:hypothetical protein